jgi:hypothetical protein
MPFSVKAYYADHPLTVTTKTAKEAFAKAVEWHVVERFTNVSISNGRKRYSIAEFSSVMALIEIAKDGRSRMLKSARSHTASGAGKAWLLGFSA